MNLPSKTFCALPWMHLSTRPDGAMQVYLVVIIYEQKLDLYLDEYVEEY